MRDSRDRRTVAYLLLAVMLFLYQWTAPGGIHLWLYPATLFFSISAAIISHTTTICRSGGGAR